MLKKLIKLYEKYRKYYFFRISCTYYKKNKGIIYSFNITVLLKKKSDIVYKEKDIKRSVFNEIQKELLCNGKFNIEPLCYLGKFRIKGKYKQYN